MNIDCFGEIKWLLGFVLALVGLVYAYLNYNALRKKEARDVAEFVKKQASDLRKEIDEIIRIYAGYPDKSELYYQSPQAYYNWAYGFIPRDDRIKPLLDKFCSANGCKPRKSFL